jgi:predicted ArsR family transcriptional regulator
MTGADPGDGRARVAALGAPGALEAIAFARAAGRPFGADEAAAALGCHRSAALRRLDRLEEAGLLVAEYRRPPGRAGPGAGRPAKLFRLAPELAVTEYPPRRYAELVALLSGDAAAPGARRRIGRRYARILAAGAARPPRRRRLDAAVPHLCALLGELGFPAGVEEATAGTARLRVPACPLRPAVVAGTAAAEIDRGMWEGLAALALSGPLRARCATHDCLDPAAECTVTLVLEEGRDDER